MQFKREPVACNLNALPYGTGTEGMYADLGHFNITAIQVIAALLLASTCFFINSRSVFKGTSNFRRRGLRT